MRQLADLLMKTGREPEAETLREELFVMGAEIYGIEHKYSSWNCEQLGSCYANQGRYDDATLHFQQTIEKVALSNAGDRGSLEAYIEQIRG